MLLLLLLLLGIHNDYPLVDLPVFHLLQVVERYATHLTQSVLARFVRQSRQLTSFGPVSTTFTHAFVVVDVHRLRVCSVGPIEQYWKTDSAVVSIFSRVIIVAVAGGKEGRNAVFSNVNGIKSDLFVALMMMMVMVLLLLLRDTVGCLDNSE